MATKIINLLTADGAYYRVKIVDGCIVGASVEYPNGTRYALTPASRNKILGDLVLHDYHKRKDYRSKPFIVAASEINVPENGLNTADSLTPQVGADLVGNALANYFGTCTY